MAFIQSKQNNLFIVVATACQNCDTQAVMMFSGKPTLEDIQLVRDEAGGINCITTKTFKQVEDDYRWEEVK